MSGPHWGAVYEAVRVFSAQGPILPPGGPRSPVPTRACANTATPCFRTLGAFLERPFWRFQPKRERGL